MTSLPNIRQQNADRHERHTIRPCDQINFAIGEKQTLKAYPECSKFFDGSNPEQQAIVTADFDGSNSMEISTALAVPFGTAGWLALVLHTIAIELYVGLHLFAWC